MGLFKSIGRAVIGSRSKYHRGAGLISSIIPGVGIAAKAMGFEGGGRTPTMRKWGKGRAPGTSAVPGSGGGTFGSPDPTVDLPAGSGIIGQAAVRWGGPMVTAYEAYTAAGGQFGGPARTWPGIFGLGGIALFGGKSGASPTAAGPRSGGAPMAGEVSQEGMAATGRLLMQVVGALMSGEPDSWIKKRVSASGISAAFRKYWPRLLTFLEAVDMPGGEEIAVDLGPSDKILISNELQRIFATKRTHRSTFITKSGERALRMVAATVKLLKKGERAVSAVKPKFTKR